MAGFFSLGSASYNHTLQQQQQQSQNPNNNTNTNSNPTESSSWFLYSTTTRNNNTTTTTKDFELWQPTHHVSTGHNLLGVSPAAAGASTIGGGGGGDGRLINFSDESTWGSAAFVMMGHGGVSGGSSGVSGGVSCQDCGNQAKKDCPHMRCRTCCKSRGFQCQTHVKSTWVPAAKRRERQQYLSGGGGGGDIQQDQIATRRRVHTTSTKRTRSLHDHDHDRNPNLVNQISNATTTAIDYNHSTELGNFPSEVTTPANFRCVRVSSIDDTDDQFAYQAAVNIGGHTFKGILYDQGPEGQYVGGDTSSGGSAGIPQLNLSAGIPQLNLTTTSPANSTAATNFIGHSLYPSLGGNDYMTSTQFFHQISRD